MAKVQDGPPPVIAVRTAALEALSLLACKKQSAGHDGRMWCAIENAELSAVSAVAFADLRAGYVSRALSVLRCNATLAVFFPGFGPDAARAAWEQGYCLGSRGMLRELHRILPAAATLPASLAPLADFVEASAPEIAPAVSRGDLGGLLLGEGGAMRGWAGQELRHGFKVVDVDESRPTFDDVRPFLVGFRTEPARRECLFRFLDFLGSPTLTRHATASRYRSAFSNTVSSLDIGLAGAPSPALGADTSTYHGADFLTAGPKLSGGGCLRCKDRCGILALSIIHGLMGWPKELVLHEALLETLRQFGNATNKLLKKVLQVSEDPRLYFAFARSLWLRGDQPAARAVLWKLCCAKAAAGGCDARIAIGWWHLECFHAGERLSPGMPPRAFRILCALAAGSFDHEDITSDAAGQDVSMQSLQAIAKLQKLLPGQSGKDAGSFRYLLSSYHATLVGLCSLVVRSSPRRALELFLREFEKHAGQYHAELGGSSTTSLLQGNPAAEQARCWELACAMFTNMLSISPGVPPRMVLEMVQAGLRIHSQSPWLLRALAAAHLCRGTLAALRRDIDHVLGLHSWSSSLALQDCSVGALCVALEAELACGARCSYERVVRLCERAAQMNAACSAFTGSAAWVLCHAMLAWKAKATSQRSPVALAEARQERWRVAVRAVAGHPLDKVLRVLQLAACEARGDSADVGGGGGQNEEEILDLVAQIEACQIPLCSDPLEAIA
mmetsp:Transcript_70251/g.228387  ORF Transcript_70251/g.228387 Transcript_70251/m.228387 type:complete len:728 (+) Transcript_70251:39-2222(+)